MIGYLIRKGREAKGLTQTALAELVGVTQQSVSQWETDQADPALDQIPRLAEVLELTAQDILDTVASASRTDRVLARAIREAEDIWNDRVWETLFSDEVAEVATSMILDGVSPPPGYNYQLAWYRAVTDRSRNLVGLTAFWERRESAEGSDFDE